MNVDYDYDVLIIDATRLQECYCHVLFIKYHIDHRSTCLFSCPLTGSGWIAGVGLGFIGNSSAASGTSGPRGDGGPGWGPPNFIIARKALGLSMALL